MSRDDEVEQQYRCYREDMIETYEILLGIYDSAVSPDLPVCQHSATRGNNYKLVKNFSRYDIRQQFFTQRIINIWNSLPLHVVNSSLVNILKIIWISSGVTKRSILTLNGNHQNQK